MFAGFCVRILTHCDCFVSPVPRKQRLRSLLLDRSTWINLLPQSTIASSSKNPPRLTRAERTSSRAARKKLTTTTRRSSQRLQSKFSHSLLSVCKFSMFVFLYVRERVSASFTCMYAVTVRMLFTKLTICMYWCVAQVSWSWSQHIHISRARGGNSLSRQRQSRTVLHSSAFSNMQSFFSLTLRTRAPRTKNKKIRVTPQRNPLNFVCVIVKDLKLYSCPLRLRPPFLNQTIYITILLYYYYFFGLAEEEEEEECRECMECRHTPKVC